MTYYTAELQNGAVAISRFLATEAKTLASAKRVAGQRQTFQGTILVVTDAAGYRVACRDAHGWHQDPEGHALNCAPDFDPTA